MNELDKSILDKIVPFTGQPAEQFQDAMIQNGKALQKIETKYVTAIAVQRPRSISKVQNNVLAEAELAGASFYYGWSTKNKDGSTGRIEGPSIDLAMCFARNYGNDAVDVEVIETPTHYLFKGFFVDLETGFTCPRLFRQRKSQNIGGRFDVDRQEDIVFQIGQSKSIRNAIVRAMPSWLVDEAIQRAKDSEVGKIKTENMELARTKVLGFFRHYGIRPDTIETKIGKPIESWIPEDIAELRGMATALKEGRISAKELFDADHNEKDDTVPGSTISPKPTEQGQEEKTRTRRTKCGRCAILYPSGVVRDSLCDKCREEVDNEVTDEPPPNPPDEPPWTPEEAEIDRKIKAGAPVLNQEEKPAGPPEFSIGYFMDRIKEYEKILGEHEVIQIVQRISGTEEKTMVNKMHRAEVLRQLKSLVDTKNA